MRPETAKRKISRILWNDFIVRDKIRDSSLKEIISILKKIEPELKYFHNRSLRINGEIDNRDGFETYGYKSEHDIKNYLEHISDRWNCTFRLRWLLDLINLDTSPLSDQIHKREKFNEGQL